MNRRLPILVTAAVLLWSPHTMAGAKHAARDKAPKYPDRSKLMEWRDAEGTVHPVKTPADWAKRRAHILLGMQEVMGPLPPASKKVPLDMQVLKVEDLPKLTRKKISFATEKDCRVPAYLLIPKGLRGKAPAAICLHPTSDIGKCKPAGVGGEVSRQYALHLAERGYVTLAPDYVRFHEYRWDPYAHGYVSATMKGIWDHMRGMDLLCGLPQVDPERIAAIGHSLGGHNAMFLAVFDPRVKVIVSSCGFNAFRWYKGGDLTGWSHKGYMPKIPSYGGWRNMPFDFHEVVAALAPRPFIVNAPMGDANFDVRGVREAVDAARQVYELHGAADKLKVLHPQCDHDFPKKIREQVYAWMDRELGRAKR